MNQVATTKPAAPAPARAANLPAIAPPRLPYHPLIEERFGIDQASWRALTEAIFPAAQSTDSVVLALSYCRARKLDPFKRVVHIVPIYDRVKKRMVDTVWPGIGELRTTAFRTKLYAGRDATKFGPDVTREWKAEGGGKIVLTFPEWAQVTVYRMIGDRRVAFDGPQVYWLETYAEGKNNVPNSMWQKRTRGQLDKCAEAAALRAAFPEEIGDQFVDDEAGIAQAAAGGIINHDDGAPTERPTRAAIEAQPAVEEVEMITATGEAVHYALPGEEASLVRAYEDELESARAMGSLAEFCEANAALRQRMNWPDAAAAVSADQPVRTVADMASDLADWIDECGDDKRRLEVLSRTPKYAAAYRALVAAGGHPLPDWPVPQGE